MKNYLNGVLVFAISFLLGLGVCYLSRANKNDFQKRIKIFQLLTKGITQNDKKKQYDAAKALFYLRHELASFSDDLIFILENTKDPLVKTLLLDTIATSPYDGKKVLCFLSDRHEDVRAAAVVALKSKPEAFEKIKAMAQQDPSPFVQQTALKHLLTIGVSQEECLSIMFQGLHSPHEEVQIVAAKMLGVLPTAQSQKIAEALMQHIEDAPGESRYVAMESLGRFDEQKVVAFVCSFLRFSDMRPYCVKALAKMSSSRREILDILDNYAIMYESVVEHVLEVVLTSQDPHDNLLPFVVKYLALENIRPSALQAFLKNKDNAVATLLKILETKDWKIKKRVLYILGELKIDSEVVHQTLLRELKKERAPKYELIVALTKTGYFAKGW